MGSPREKLAVSSGKKGSDARPQPDCCANIAGGSGAPDRPSDKSKNRLASALVIVGEASRAEGWVLERRR
ncbi:protein of unknown function [Aminobacter niigataensis]|nr:protein of unknown function [Aminobacter niigataensis]